MRIVTLLENDTTIKELKSNHGLSLYIETNNKKILFDLGPNKNFLYNSNKLNIDLKGVDYLIISHGHYDHATELNYFLQYNKKARVYISPHAFDNHVGKVGVIVKDIGISKVEDETRLNYVDGTIEIDKGIMVTSEVKYKEEVLSDERLYVKEEKNYSKDTFKHEIYLILSEYDQNILVTGCSHKGIRNILDSLEGKFGITFDYVIGGFHFKRFNDKKIEHRNYLDVIGNEFNMKNSKFFACHCTGKQAFDYLNQTMNNLHSLHTGDEIIIKK